jgi:hypothetical protein
VLTAFFDGFECEGWNCQISFISFVALTTFVFVPEDAKKEDVESGPEEEEVPTRGFLKRQANMIVDAKSRSKRGNRRR